MKKEHLAFLLGGFAFGIIVGYAVFNAVDNAPLGGDQGAAQAATAPSGPMAPTQMGGDGAAPMMAEINALKQHLQDAPDDLASTKRLANIYHEVGMWEQATEFYERAIRLEPNNPDLITDLGVCQRGLGQYARALELFDEAQKINPSHWQSLFNTAIVAGFDLGEWDRADAALDAMAGMSPPPPRLAELREALNKARAEAEG